MRYGVGLDGSNVCYRALEVVLGLIDPQFDEVWGLHVADPNRLSSRMLHVNADAKMVGRDVVLHWAEAVKVEKTSTASQLVKLALANNLDFLCIGAYGRKGEQIEEMGHVADGSLRASGLNTMIVKNTSYVPKPGEPRTFVYATDGSVYAERAFSLCVRYIRPTDNLHVISVTNSPKIPNIEYFQTISSLKMLKPTFEAIRPTHDHLSAADNICDYSLKVEADFLVMGYGGHSLDAKKLKMELGSVTQQCKKNSKCTVMILKPQSKWKTVSAVFKGMGAFKGALNKSYTGHISPHLQATPRGDAGNFNRQMKWILEKGKKKPEEKKEEKQEEDTEECVYPGCKVVGPHVH